MKVSQNRDEEAWVALLDELWEMGISPDSGVEWVVCDGDLAIEAGVETAYPGVEAQRCISHGDPVRRPQLKRGLEYLRSPRKGVPSTTSKMERAIREYRRRTRPMDGFKTDRGADNFNHLWMARERAKKNGQDWLWEVMN